MRLIVNTDGSTYPSPRGAAIYGYVIRAKRDDGRKIKGRKKWCLVLAEEYGHTDDTDATCVVAEYVGLIEALARCSELAHTRVVVRMDNKGIIDQMNGITAVRANHLKHYHKLAKSWSKCLKNVTYEWVPRTNNKKADELCSIQRSYLAYQAQTGGCNVKAQTKAPT